VCVGVCVCVCVCVCARALARVCVCAPRLRHAAPACIHLGIMASGLNNANALQCFSSLLLKKLGRSPNPLMSAAASL